jgi:hypothetical protein
MTHDVFISYSAKDQKIIEGLSAYLEQNGIRCWIAYRDIPIGADWAEYIPPAIENCKTLIYVHSSSSNVSQEINKEIALCLKNHHPIIPFRIQDVDYSNAKAYHLQTINWIDAFPNPEKHFGELLTKIQNLFPEFKKEGVSGENKSAEIKKTDIKSDADDIKLMKILSIIGIVVTPLGGLFGIFYLAHALFALYKNMTTRVNAMGTVVFGLICFPFLLLLNVIILTHSNNFREALLPSTFMIGPFGLIYSILWIAKLNTLSSK